jgi:Tfp pilus assembly protein PilV
MVMNSVIHRPEQNRTALPWRELRGVKPMRGSRRGAALIDVIIGAIMLGIGLSVIISVSSRSLAMQNDGERRMVAAWLADELLNHVVIEGPEEYRRNVDLRGEYGAPFEGYSYEVQIEDIGLNMPFRVTVTVSWPSGRAMQQVQVQTLIAEKRGEMFEEHRREPDVMLDREQWHYERRFGPEDL